MSSAELCDGSGGLKKVVVKHASGAEAEVYLWGATVTSYRDPTATQRIFMSPGAIFDGKKAIRGGVPVVFPQFGQPDKAMPQHGFVRTSEWSVGEMKEDGDAMTVTLTLTESPASLEKWPHKFSLEYLVSLKADSLTMCLRATNTGETTFNFMSLLHTYLLIDDVANAQVVGLKGLKYIDKVAGGETKENESEVVTVPSFTDSVFVGEGAAPREVTVSEGSTLTCKVVNSAAIAGEAHACDVVVWNPYEEASPGDLPVPAYKGFVCVEPGLVSAMRELPPGKIGEVQQLIVPGP